MLAVLMASRLARRSSSSSSIGTTFILAVPSSSESASIAGSSPSAIGYGATLLIRTDLFDLARGLTVSSKSITNSFNGLCLGCCVTTLMLGIASLPLELARESYARSLESLVLFSSFSIVLSKALSPADSLFLYYDSSSSIGMKLLFLSNLEIRFSSARLGCPRWPHVTSTRWPSGLT